MFYGLLQANIADRIRWSCLPAGRMGNESELVDGGHVGRELHESRCCLIESVDVGVSAREYHSALESGHDMKGTTRCIGPAQPTREILNATAKKQLYLYGDLGRQDSGFCTEDATKAHPTIPIECRSKGGPIGPNRIAGAFIRPCGDRSQKAVSITSGDRGSHLRLGGEMMMHTRALNTDLGCEIAKAKSGVATVADMRFGNIH